MSPKSRAGPGNLPQASNSPCPGIGEHCRDRLVEIAELPASAVIGRPYLASGLCQALQQSCLNLLYSPGIAPTGLPSGSSTV